MAKVKKKEEAIIHNDKNDSVVWTSFLAKSNKEDTKHTINDQKVNNSYGKTHGVEMPTNIDDYAVRAPTNSYRMRKTATKVAQDHIAKGFADELELMKTAVNLKKAVTSVTTFAKENPWKTLLIALAGPAAATETIKNVSAATSMMSAFNKKFPGEVFNPGQPEQHHINWLQSEAPGAKTASVKTRLLSLLNPRAVTKRISKAEKKILSRKVSYPINKYFPAK